MSQVIVEQLVDTRINGNSIRGNDTYERMLKRVTKSEINHFSVCLLGYAIETGLTKLQMIEDIRDAIDKGRY